MTRGLLGGMTDYSHHSFADIIGDLKFEQRNVTAFLEKIEQNLKKVVDNGFWNSKVISDFRLQVAYSIKHFPQQSLPFAEWGLCAKQNTVTMLNLRRGKICSICLFLPGELRAKSVKK